jgi:archaellum component FlaF (FlaF/FlaG flagellin family)
MDYFDKKIKSGNTYLSRWQNANAKIWEYSITHTNITIRLEKDDMKGNLHIVVLEPISYEGKFKWSNSNFDVSFNGQYVELRDRENDVLLVGEDVNFYENCKPIF